MTARERWEAQMGNSIAEIARAMGEKKRKREMDLIAQEVAEQYGLEGIDSAEELKMALTLRSSDMERQLKNAQIQRALREPPPVDEEGLTPYQRRQLELSAKREERLSQPRARTMTPLQELQAEKLRRELAAEVAGQSADSDPAIAAIDEQIAKAREAIAKGNRRPGPDAFNDWTAKTFPKIGGVEPTYEDQLSELNTRKRKLTNGAEPNAAPYAQPVRPQVAAPKIPADAIVVDTPEEAEQLPPGTVFYTPDGRRKVRP